LDYYAESEWNMVKPTISVTCDGTEYEAVVVARHKTRDMALLSFEKGDLLAAELALNMDNCARICHWGSLNGAFSLQMGEFRPETPHRSPTYDISTGYGTGGVGIFAFEKDCKLRLCAVAFGTDEAGKTQVTSLSYIKEFLKGIKELE
jgi:hypothetical protein